MTLTAVTVPIDVFTVVSGVIEKSRWVWRDACHNVCSNARRLHGRTSAAFCQAVSLN